MRKTYRAVVTRPSLHGLSAHAIQVMSDCPSCHVKLAAEYVEHKRGTLNDQGFALRVQTLNVWHQSDHAHTWRREHYKFSWRGEKPYEPRVQCQCVEIMNRYAHEMRQYEALGYHARAKARHEDQQRVRLEHAKGACGRRDVVPQ